MSLLGELIKLLSGEQVESSSSGLEDSETLSSPLLKDGHADAHHHAPHSHHGNHDLGHSAHHGHHHHHSLAIREAFELVELCTLGISFLGAFFLVAGTLLAMFNLTLTVFNALFSAHFHMVGISSSEYAHKASLYRVRLQLGGFTALGLQVLIAADILETLTRPSEEQSYETLGKICIIAAFRTALSYFLGLEMKEVHEELHHEEMEEKGHGHGHGHGDEKHGAGKVDEHASKKLDDPSLVKKTK